MIADPRGILAVIESGWRQARILVVGDMMLDKYVWGEVDRISPEAPVPVVRAALQDEKPGGAANVAMNLAGLGGCVTACGFAGDDPERERLESLLAEAGVEPMLTTTSGSPTTTKLRILAGHQQIIRLDNEAAATHSAAAYEEMLQHALECLPDVSAVVLSDYAKGVLTAQVCRVLIERARQLKIPVLVDPKNSDFTRYRGATTICPNRKELAAATGEPSAGLERVLAGGQAMLSSLQLEFMTVTLGEKGIAVLHAGSRLHVPAVARQVYDVSGAGDTVVAVLALAMACGVEIETAVEVANIAAGVVVSKVGTAPIGRDELLGAMSHDVVPLMDEKILPLDRLLSRVAGWRSAGQHVVFTNGCFDLLHVGHITLLEQARRLGDRLVVGLNSDNSVRRVKGPQRPTVGQHERAKILAALSAVDAVVIFGESTPLRLIETLRPDVLVKGGDYTQENVIGAREVRAWGGRVELIPLVEGVSTTRLIAKSAASVGTAAILQPSAPC